MVHKKKKESIQEELEALAPTLCKLKESEKPVDIPLHYFDHLPAEVFQRIREEQPAVKVGLWEPFHQRITSIFLQPAYALALAGVAILVICLSLFPRNTYQQADTETALSEEDINKYIDYHLDDFELGLLVEEATFDPAETEIFTEEDSLKDKAMEDYFDQLLDDIDLEELL